MLSSNWVIFLVVKYFTFAIKGLELELTFEIICVLCGYLRLIHKEIRFLILIILHHNLNFIQIILIHTKKAR